MCHQPKHLSLLMAEDGSFGSLDWFTGLVHWIFTLLADGARSNVLLNVCVHLLFASQRQVTSMEPEVDGVIMKSIENLYTRGLWHNYLLKKHVGITFGAWKKQWQSTQSLIAYSLALQMIRHAELESGGSSSCSRQRALDWAGIWTVSLCVCPVLQCLFISLWVMQFGFCYNVDFLNRWGL